MSNLICMLPDNYPALLIPHLFNPTCKQYRQINNEKFEYCKEKEKRFIKCFIRCMIDNHKYAFITNKQKLNTIDTKESNYSYIGINAVGNTDRGSGYVFNFNVEKVGILIFFKGSVLDVLDIPKDTDLYEYHYTTIK